MLDNRVELTNRDNATKGLHHLLLIATTVAIVILIAASVTYLTIKEENRETEREINNTLTALLNTTHDSLVLWQEDLTFHINQLTEAPEVINYTLNATGSHSQANTKLATFINTNAPPHSLGFEIVSSDQRIIGASDASLVGKPSTISLHAADYFERALTQKNSLTILSNESLHDPVIVISGAIVDQQNTIIGHLFLRINSKHTFADISALGKAGKTSQAFAFDEHGNILTPVQSPPSYTGPASRASPEQPALIPNVHRFTSHEKETLPVTYKTDTQYGAAVWYDALNIGLATEISRQEAEHLYSNRNILITAAAASIALIFAAVFAITTLFNRFKMRDLEKAKHQLEEVVSTRTQELITSNEGLENARDGLNHIIQSMPISMITFDRHGYILQYNRSACDLFGYKEDEFCHLKLSQLIANDEQNHYLSDSTNLFNNHDKCRSFGMEISALHSSGDTFPVAITISMIENDDGAIAVANILDLRKERAEEMEKELHNRQLSQSQKMRAITQLVSGISHDFNNIITSIKGHGEIIQEAAEENDITTITKCQEVIAKSCEHAQSLTQQLLTFGRNEIDSKELIAINQTVSDALQIARAAIPSTISLINKTTATDTTFIETNATKLHQALLNLLLNARDALNDRGIIEVGITHKHHSGVCSSCHESFDDDYVELYVKDNGTGITPGAIQSIFEPFFTTKPQAKGSGMGLPMVHGIVHGSSGHIVIETGDGGSTFHLLFPPYKESDRPIENKEISATPPSKRVMIVDDDIEITRFLEKVLKSNGYETAAYNSPLLALKDIRSNPGLYSAMIADIVMPDMQGLELSLTVSHEFPQIPVILCSGYTKLVNAASISKYGAKAFFAKPFEVPVLIEKLQELVPDKSSPFYRI